MIDKSWYERPPNVPEHTSAGGVVVRQEHGNIFVALVREKGLKGYVLPKGHLEAGETLEQAARREVEEEAGLTAINLLGKLGIRARLDYNRTSWKITHYFLFVTGQLEGTPTDHQQHEGFDWFPINNLPMMFWPEQRELIEANRDEIVAKAMKAGEASS